MLPALKAYDTYKPEAHSALRAFQKMAPNFAGRVAGCDTVIRLAVRIANGRTINEAASREYLYRWTLAIEGTEWAANAFAPHALGM